jgi:hypothetical protein
MLSHLLLSIDDYYIAIFRDFDAIARTSINSNAYENDDSNKGQAGFMTIINIYRRIYVVL